jgi:uncharacterized protein YggE
MTRVMTLATLLTCSMPMAALAQIGPPAVVTQGEWVVKRAPDRAWLTVATETRDARAERARQMSAEAMTALQASLKAAGLAEDAIRTTGYSLVPEMDWKSGRGVVRGYVVRNQIEVRVDDLDRLSAVIDAATTAKATTLSVTGPRFGLKDEAAAEAEALRAAVSMAMNRARAIAMGAGRTLGAITRIEDHNLGGDRPPQPLMRMTAEAASTPTPIEPGEIEVRAAVTMTIELR